MITRKAKKFDEFDYIGKDKDPDRFEIKFISKTKGKGVFAKEFIHKGEFLFEYRGQLMNEEPKEVTYMFEFKHQGHTLWIDASKDDKSLGRMVNDDYHMPNAVAKKVITDIPRIIFHALRDINIGEEVFFNYDSTKLQTFSWRKESSLNESSDEYQSSGEEWKPPSHSETTTVYKKKRVGEWVRQIPSLKHTDVDQNRTPLSTRRQPTKQLPHPVREDSDIEILDESSDISFVGVSERGRQSKRSPPNKRRRQELSSTLRKLKIHELLVHESSQIPKKGKQCHICGKEVQNVKRHVVETHQIKEETSIKMKDSHRYIIKTCPLCGEPKQRLRQHLKNKHKQEAKAVLDEMVRSAVPVTDAYKVKIQKKKAKDSDGNSGSLNSNQRCQVQAHSGSPSNAQRTEQNIDDSKVAMKSAKSFRDEPWLRAFNHWLLHDKGMKQKDVNEHSSKVYRIWTCINPSEERLRFNDLISYQKIKDIWFPTVKDKPIGTIKSFIQIVP